jgi:hypothetical protein
LAIGSTELQQLLGVLKDCAGQQSCFLLLDLRLSLNQLRNFTAVFLFAQVFIDNQCFVPVKLLTSCSLLPKIAHIIKIQIAGLLLETAVWQRQLRM